MSSLVLNLADDLATLKPTVFAGVPRVYNKVFDKIAKETLYHKGIRGTAFRKAYYLKRENLQQGKGLHHGWLDSLIFKRISAAFGGNIKIFITGSAPISAKVKEFFRLCFSAEMLEGYGATETCAMGSFDMPGDYSGKGNVGYPSYGGQIRWESVREMQYLTTDFPSPRGEVLVKGPFVFKGYYKDGEKTAEVLSPDGWYHTGDIGLVDQSGKLSIIDRKKHIFKLSQGEYVAPEKLENIYAKIGQIFVYGSSMESYLVAVVVPELDAIGELRKSFCIPESTELDDIVQRQDVKVYFLEQLAEIAKDHSLAK
jgi:long-chain acyl-CoA synthetase